MVAVPQPQGSGCCHPAGDKLSPRTGMGLGGKSIPQVKSSACLGGGVRFRNTPSGSKSLPSKGGSSLSDPRARLIHAEVVSVPYPSGCWQRYAFCSHIVC